MIEMTLILATKFNFGKVDYDCYPDLDGYQTQSISWKIEDHCSRAVAIVTTGRLIKRANTPN